MQPILVAYATTEGHTRKVAEFIAERLRIRGHRVDLVDVAGATALDVTAAYQAAFIGGSVHQHRHQC
jgi:menaquinone-dependent protoporphyrinogen oxidase